MTHAELLILIFANIDAVKEYLAEGVAEKINASGELEIVPADNQFPVTKQCHSVMVVLTNLLIHTHLTTVQQHSDWEHLININSG